MSEEISGGLVDYLFLINGLYCVCRRGILGNIPHLGLHEPQPCGPIIIASYMNHISRGKPCNYQPVDP